MGVRGVRADGMPCGKVVAGEASTDVMRSVLVRDTLPGFSMDGTFKYWLKSKQHQLRIKMWECKQIV